MSFIFLSFCGAASHAGSQLRSAVERAAHNGSARRGKEESARLNVYFKSVELVYLAVNADRLRFVELKHAWRQLTYSQSVSAVFLSGSVPSL